MSNEEEEASKKKLLEDFARQNALPTDGLEIAPSGRYRVKYGSTDEWLRAHGYTPMDEVFKRLGDKYFGGDGTD